MGYGLNKYDIQVKDQDCQDGYSTDGDIASGVYVFVYDAGTKTLSTIYADDAKTTLANPITRTQFATDTRIKFWAASTSYDIVVWHSDGTRGAKAGATPNTHTLKINRNGADGCLVFPLLFNSGGTEVDTGLVLPSKAFVYDVALEVITVDATETVDIGLLSSGTGGDADGFLAGASVASAGFVKPFVNTVGSNETYVSSAKYGVLLGPSVVGTDVDKDDGVARGWGHVVDGSNTGAVTYTPSTSDTFAGYGYLMFKKLR